MGTLSVDQQQLELLQDTVAPVSLATMKAMRRVFDRRWRRWHWCLRFEDACRDPVTFRLLRLSVERGRGGPACGDE
jgi:hypothetical protein